MADFDDVIKAIKKTSEDEIKAIDGLKEKPEEKLENANGGRHRENRQGKDFSGFKEHLKGIFRNPSLAKFQG